MESKYTKAIIKQLDKILAGPSHQSQIFADWLDMVLASLEALPNHAKAAKSGTPFEDTQETQELWERLRRRYDQPHYWDAFAAAFAALLDSAAIYQADGQYMDIIGAVYMEWGIPNKYTGQFFTPYHLAEAMADISLGDIEQNLHSRIKDAVTRSPFAQAAVLAGSVCQTPEEARQWYFTRVLPIVIPDIDPITVQDCACGSGVMLLAAAAACPRWAVDYGLIQFYGQDIDLTCVKMARINMMLYGLNGYSARCALESMESVSEPEPAIEEPKMVYTIGHQLPLFEMV